MNIIKTNILDEINLIYDTNKGSIKLGNQIGFVWIAHENNTYNNLADEYAVLSMKNQKNYNIENYTTTNV